jgi:mannitol/fructose-specific phosphotransferase system IIA component (Ntr-type)
MAEVLDPKELVTLQELAVSNTYEIAALVAVLERKGLVTPAEVLEEIKRLKQKAGNPQ